MRDVCRLGKFLKFHFEKYIQPHTAAFLCHLISSHITFALLPFPSFVEGFALSPNASWSVVTISIKISCAFSSSYCICRLVAVDDADMMEEFPVVFVFSCVPGKGDLHCACTIAMDLIVLITLVCTRLYEFKFIYSIVLYYALWACLFA